jgi:hypothetical protein
MNDFASLLEERAFATWDRTKTDPTNQNWRVLSGAICTLNGGPPA